MLLQWIKNIFYSLFVESGLVYHVVPLFKRFIFVIVKPLKIANYQIVDDGGAKINVTKMGNGKIFPPLWIEKLSSVKDIRVRDSDVLICGYPKTGCHWVFEILHMLLNRTLTVSQHGKVFGGMIEFLPDFILDSIPSPRILNSHLTYDELPTGIKTRKTKIILTTRSAKDTVVSYYNHVCVLKEVYGYDGTFDNFFKLFVKEELDYGGYFSTTRNWNDVLRSHPVNDIFVLRFEELKEDPVAIIVKLALFLDINIDKFFAQQVAEASNFSNVKKAKSSDSFQARFLRKGIVGDWKNWMTPAQVEEIDRKWEHMKEQCEQIYP